MATPFLNLLASQPAATGTAATEVGVAATNINNLAGVIRTAMSVADWQGSSKDGQQRRLGEFMTLFQQLLTSMTQIQATASAGATQIQASKLVTEANVTAAQSGRYVVLPTGNVQPGPWHYSFASTHPGSMGVFRAIAGMLTARIHAAVGQSKAVDMQVAAAIAQVALEYLGGWLDQKLFPSSAGAGTGTPPATLTPGTVLPGTLPAGTLPGAGVTPVVVTTQPADPTFTGAASGTGLAGAAGLGTAATLGGAGLTLPGGLGAAGTPATGAGLMLGGGAAGAAAGGVIGATGGAAARGGAGAVSMAPYGAAGGGAGGGGERRHGHGTDLTEDDRPWDQGDAPDAVLR